MHPMNPCPHKKTHAQYMALILIGVIVLIGILL